jgi:predicted ATP-dependent serine protease
MGEKSLVMRMIQKHAKDWEEAILEREKKAQNLDLIFSMDIEEIEAYIEKSTAELVIIDFLQNITVANGSSSREKIRDVIARIIKAIKDKKFCILASQFNAE